MFDQYEIDIEITKHRHSYLNTGQGSTLFFVKKELFDFKQGTSHHRNWIFKSLACGMLFLMQVGN